MTAPCRMFCSTSPRYVGDWLTNNAIFSPICPLVFPSSPKLLSNFRHTLCLEPCPSTPNETPGGALFRLVEQSVAARSKDFRDEGAEGTLETAEAASGTTLSSFAPASARGRAVEGTLETAEAASGTSLNCSAPDSARRRAFPPPGQTETAEAASAAPGRVLSPPQRLDPAEVPPQAHPQKPPKQQLGTRPEVGPQKGAAPVGLPRGPNQGRGRETAEAASVFPPLALTPT